MIFKILFVEQFKIFVEYIHTNIYLFTHNYLFCILLLFIKFCKNQRAKGNVYIISESVYKVYTLTQIQGHIMRKTSFIFD